MKVLFLGDIVGKPGRTAVRHFVPILRERHGLDLCVGNSENSAGGAGITPDSADDLLDAGLDLLTGGNHTWSKREILPYLDREGSRQLRPANYPDGAPGRGHGVVTSKSGSKLGVVNLEGRLFMKPLDCPFRTAERLVSELRRQTACILVDMHCEATSEKNAMGHFLDGRVIGLRKEFAIERFLSARHTPFDLAQGETVLQGAIVEIDDQTGRARSIVRVREMLAG